MTPKEKANELFNKYFSMTWQTHKSTRTYKQIGMSKSAALHCALVAVAELLEATWETGTCKRWGLIDTAEYTKKDYWEQVKIELNNI